MPRTLIIGTGISAVAYLQSIRLSRGEDHVVTVGGQDLWRSVHEDHKMGQPAQLLTGNLLQGPRGFQTPPVPGQNFMLAKDFAGLLDRHLAEKSNAKIPGSWVEEITPKEGKTYEVKVKVGRDTHTLHCDNVIIAVGPGPGRPLMAGEDGKLDVDVKGLEGHVVGGTEFMSPDWTMPGNPQYPPSVAVYGGSATAAWVVELAILRRMHVSLWFTRPGEGDAAWNAGARFREAFPPGERNTRVEKDTKDVRQVLKLTDVRFHKPYPAHSFIALEFRDKDNTRIVRCVDLLVYALGAAHTQDTGILKMLHPSIVPHLLPLYDRNLALSSKPCLLAVGLKDRSLMIVGSAMSSAAGFSLGNLDKRIDRQDPYFVAHERTLINQLKDPIKLAAYKDISDTLPPAARPTEGIAMVMAGIEALNDYMPAKPVLGGRKRTYTTPNTITAQKTGANQPDRGSINPVGGQERTHDLDFTWDINFNTSNRTQLAAFLAQSTDLTPLAANLAVALIVRLRAQSRNPLGLTDEQVEFIIKRADGFADAQQKYNEGLEERRRQYDHRWGADWYLEVLVDLMTKDPTQASYWEAKGIHCDVNRV